MSSKIQVQCLAFALQGKNALIDPYDVVRLKALMKNTNRNPAAAKKMSSARLLLLWQWMQWEDPIARL